MKLSKIVKAYKNLESLAPIKDLNKEEQWALFQLRHKLRPHCEFQDERLSALTEKYKEFANEDGNLTGEKASEYVNELNELNNMDIEINVEKPKVRLVEGVSFITAEQLEDFIEFTPC